MRNAPAPDEERALNAREAGRRAEQKSDWKAAYADYSEAVTYAPSDRDYPILKEHARFQMVQGMVEAAERRALAGNIPDARAILSQALVIDPNYSVARERLSELADDSVKPVPDKNTRLAGLPRLHPKPGALDFDYRGTTRGAYEEIGRQFGVTVVFDGDLHDRAIRFRAPMVDFDTAVMVISRQTNTFTRVVDEHTLFVTDDSPQKEKDYAPEIEKTILLPASVTSDEMNETVRMVREMTGISRTQLNTAEHTLTVRSTEQNVALAQALLEQIEQPRGELMLEIEILELDRSAGLQLGITPPSSETVTSLSQSVIQQLKSAQNNGTLIQELQSIFGSIGGLGTLASGISSAALPLLAFGGGKTIFIASVPGATANFSQSLSAVMSAQRILLRAQDGKPATFFVGDRYPISLGLLSSDLNSAPSALTSAVTSGLLSGLSLPRTDYPTGTGPSGVAIADFNGDGIPDLVVANETAGSISILLGAGAGAFQTQTSIPLPAGASAPAPSAVVTGDFNMDGHIDIAVTDSANNLVYILLGNGNGTFATPVAYPTGSVPVALVAQDFDGDGQPDLAVVNQGDGKTSSTVSILLGDKVNGVQNGAFGAKTDYPVGVSPSAITTGIFNTGGFTSLAVTNKADNTVSILLGQGTNGVQNGTFGTQTTFATGNGPAGVATSDFNGDGFADLAVTNQTDGTVSILLGNGTGNGNGAFTAQPAITTGAGPVGIVAANFTGSNTDLAVADETANNIEVLIGNGNGTFTTPIVLPTGNAPVAVAAADLIGNGSIDLVSANQASNSVTVTLNTVQSALSSATAGQTAYPSAQYEDLGLKIKATPRLHGNDEVTLQMNFDIKSLAGSSINGIPILSNRSIEQTVRLRENETSILSGLIQSNEATAVSGLPWTSSIPDAGLATSEDTSNKQRTELLILVTPRAVRLPPHEFPAIYAGRGEPATPPAQPTTPPFGAAPPPGAPIPAPPGGPGPNPGFPGGRPGFPQPPVNAPPVNAPPANIPPVQPQGQ
ncbi:MAG: FG-GAP-like repeat-containing protein [Candidatus Acidiferrales bacterium]